MLNRPSLMETYQPNHSWEDPTAGIAILDPLLGPHEVEQNVWHELQQVSSGHFSSLVVRRLPDGVCLQGVIETADIDFLDDVERLVKRVACVDRVLNQLLIRECNQ